MSGGETGQGGSGVVIYAIKNGIFHVDAYGPTWPRTCHPLPRKLPGDAGAQP